MGRVLERHLVLTASASLSTQAAVSSSSSSSSAAASTKRRPVVKGIVSPMREVPDTVGHPDYALTGRPRPSPNHVVLFKDPAEVAKIRAAARLARKMLDFANSLVAPGITTDDIDYLTHQEIVKHGAYPSPVNYCGFPKAMCASVNEVVCHGIPDNRKLLDGDVISIDVSVFLDGYHGDNCGTVVCGATTDPSLLNLIAGTQEALDKAIAICRPGRPLGMIGEVIDKVASRRGLQVVREFCGHGTGPSLHMQPLVEHVTNKSPVVMQPGMVFTIEPILGEGSRRITTWPDGWSAVTMDGGRGAQFEHEVRITEDGVEVLTIPEP
jgi:methionyl aminopeptidase